MFLKIEQYGFMHKIVGPLKLLFFENLVKISEKRQELTRNLQFKIYFQGDSLGSRYEICLHYLKSRFLD